MAWYHHVTKGHAGFVDRHPIWSAILGAVGVGAVINIAMGTHATPPPATQNVTPKTGS